MQSAIAEFVSSNVAIRCKAEIFVIDAQMVYTGCITMADRATVSLADLQRGILKDNPEANPALTNDQLLENAITALNTLRGLNRSDKIKVIRRMRKLLDA